MGTLMNGTDLSTGIFTSVFLDAHFLVPSPLHYVSTESAMETVFDVVLMRGGKRGHSSFSHSQKSPAHF